MVDPFLSTKDATGQIRDHSIFAGVKPKTIMGKPHQIAENGGIERFRGPADLLRKVKQQIAAMSVQERPAVRQALWITKLLVSVPDELIDDLAAKS
jgi:hypothetical protein